MPQSPSKVLVDVVFCTKDRYPFLTPEVRPELHAYAATVLKSCESPAIVINSVTEHIHVLCALSKNWAICDLIQNLQTGTSKWIKSKGGILQKFHWQNGYGVFSVSRSQVGSVRKYITTQEAHHRRVTFEEDFRSLLQKHEREYDER